LTSADFDEIAEQIGVTSFCARKTGFVVAEKARGGEVVDTRWNGKETTNTARKGDWIVTNSSSRGETLRDRERHENRYVIAADRFSELYEQAASLDSGGTAKLYRAKGIVTAIRLDGGFDIVAPWGERQTAPAGYLILNGDEVYGNNAETFALTYEKLAK
jgi:hypothetical protein